MARYKSTTKKQVSSQTATQTVAKKENSSFYLKDNRKESIVQQKQNNTNVSDEKKQFIQKKQNNTGLPDNLKSGIENLSGYSMDDVKVHYNSDKPAQLNAHAYAQGTDIHLASGQEKHLPHEAWHVVQQKQGRVKPTMQMKGKVNINDDVGLEKEADLMGEKSVQLKKTNTRRKLKKNSSNIESIQLNGLNQQDYRELAGAATEIISNSISHVASARGVSVTIGLIKDLVIDLLGIGSLFDTGKLAYYYLRGETENAKEAFYSILASLSGLDSIKKVIDGLIELDGGDGRRVLLKTKAYKKIIGKLD